MPKHHLSFEEKKELLKLHSSGVPITRLATQYHISRAVIYKWIQDPQYARKTQPAASVHHWKGYSEAIQKKIIKYSLNNPDLSAQDVAEKLGLGHNGVWRTLKKHGLSTRLNRINYLASPAFQIKRSHSSIHKIEAIKRYYQGESATKLCRELGISRTIFYQWLNMYQTSNQNPAVFESKRPRKASHWRFLPEARDRVIEIVRAHPEFSAHAISEELRKRSLALSHNTVHTILREQNLSRYHARVAFAGTVALAPVSGTNLLALPAPKPIVLLEPNSMVQVENPMSHETLKSILGITTLGGIVVCMILSVVFGSWHFTERLGQENAGGYVSQTLEVSPTPNLLTVKPKSDRAPLQEHASPVLGVHDSGGVLAMNTDKIVYKVGDTVSMIFGLVDGKGNVECEAELEVEVSGPNKTDRTNVYRGETCDLQEYSVMPDYWAYFWPEEVGLHQVKVTAKTKDGVISSNQQIQVLSDEEYAALPYVIKRTSMPTRVRPDWTYRAETQVVFHKNFTGFMTEKLDEHMRINAVYTPEAQEGGLGKEIKWNVQGLAGETKSLVYSVGFVEPPFQIHKLGPMNVEMVTGLAEYEYTWQSVVSQ